jgi:hypothetical protein
MIRGGLSFGKGIWKKGLLQEFWQTFPERKGELLLGRSGSIDSANMEGEEGRHLAEANDAVSRSLQHPP